MSTASPLPLQPPVSPTIPSSSATSIKPARTIPPGFLPYTENGATILLPASSAGANGGSRARVNPQAGVPGSASGPSSAGRAKVVPPSVDQGMTPDSSHLFTPTSTNTDAPAEEQTAFLNPVQEYNRDLSVAIIKEWSFLRLEEIKAKWEKGQLRRAAAATAAGARGKGRGGGRHGRGAVREQVKVDDEEGKDGAADGGVIPSQTNESAQSDGKTPEPKITTFINPKFTVIEALSATGLRSVRYAQELENVGLVLANDFSPSACEAMKRNVDFNDIGAIFTELPPVEGGMPVRAEYAVARGRKRKRVERGGVVVNEGDACTLMYNHRGEHDRVDVVDLDPYGTAAPFIDAAVQSVSDGGLLCVTCTDLAVMAGHNYPEKCFANYGGTPAKAEYCHEAALRLLIASISTAASRYGRYVEPLLSLSIDFYVRIFVRVYTGPLQVKEIFAKQGIVYICSYCQAFHPQAFGRVMQKTSAKGIGLTAYKFASGPPVTQGNKCDECGGTYQVAGPMWLGPIHKPEFIDRVLTRLEDTDKGLYRTYPRMKGMMAVARDELEDLFFYNPSKSASFLRSQCPSLAEFASALLTGGYKISRSHCVAGSIKTDAPPAFVHDVLKELIKSKPVRKDKIPEGSPAMVMLAKEQSHEVSLVVTEDGKKFTSKTDLVRYQFNPTANWGPGMRAKTVRTSTTIPTAPTIKVEPEESNTESDAAEEKAVAVKLEDIGAEEEDVKMDLAGWDEEEAMMEEMMNGGEAALPRGAKRASEDCEGGRPAKK